MMQNSIHLFGKTKLHKRKLFSLEFSKTKSVNVVYCVFVVSLKILCEIRQIPTMVD